MKNTVVYEWSIETLDENGDIIDSDFSETPFEVVESNQRMCLVRNEGNEVDGLTDRLWAYVVDGRLPDVFENGEGYPVSCKVPERFKNIKL